MSLIGSGSLFDRMTTFFQHTPSKENKISSYRRSEKFESLAKGLSSLRPHSTRDSKRPIIARQAGIHPQFLHAMDEMTPLETTYQLGMRDDIIRPEYTFDQLEAQERYRNDIASFWFFMVKGGRHVLEFLGVIARSHVLTSAGRVAGQFMDPIIDGLAYKDEQVKARQHGEQIEISTHVGESVLKNSQLTTDDIEQIYKDRLAAIKSSKELEKILQRDVGKEYTFTKKELDKCIDDNSQLNPTHKRLLHGFVKGVHTDTDGIITFKELRKQYANHTIGLSIMTRSALIKQNSLKNKMEKKFFELKRTTEGWRFSISVAAGVTWFTLNMLTWLGVGITADATMGLGGAFAAIGLALTLIGLGVIAYRSPHQFLEVIKGTYILKSLHEARKGIYKYIFGYNSKLSKANKELTKIHKEMDDLRISKTDFDKLNDSIRAYYTEYKIDDKIFYVLKAKIREFDDLLTSLKKTEAHADKFQSKLIKFYQSAKVYRSKISQAKIKDHQRMFRLYEMQADKKVYIDSFMDEVAVIAASDLSRNTYDRISNDIANLLVRQYCVAIPNPEGRIATEKEIYDAINKGLEYFMGADIDRLAKLNNRLRRGRDATHRYVIVNALFGDQRSIAREHINMLGLTINIDESRLDSKVYRRKVAERVRKEISRKLTPDQAMMFYGTLWNIIKGPADDKTERAA